TRTQQCEAYPYAGREGGFAKTRQAIQEAKIGEEEKRALLQAVAIDEADARLWGFHAPDEDGGIKAALEASLRIEDPRLRFIQQRSIVHETIKDDDNIPEVRYRIESSQLDDEAKARLLKECERLSGWHRWDKKG